MKVAINGVGVAGPTLAWWLKKLGHDVVLYEIASELRAGGYVIDFWGKGYDIAEKMGILPSIHELGYQVKELRLVNDAGKKVSRLDMSIAEKVIAGRYTSIARSDLARAIYESLITAWPDIEVHFDDSILSYTEKDQGVEIITKHGNTKMVDVVIGADGLHSHVRSLAFENDQQYLHDLGYYVAAFELEDYPHRDKLAYVMHRDIKRSISRFTLHDSNAQRNRTLFMFVFAAELIDARPHADEEKRAVIHALCKDMAWEVPEINKRIAEVENIYFDGVTQVRMPKWHNGQVGLIGDAAACPSLLAGEGTGLAMIEAYVLAHELHTHQAHLAEGFASYESILGDFLADKQKSALSSALMFAPKNKLYEKITDIGITLGNIPFLAKKFAASTFEDNVDLPDYSNLHN